MSWKYVNPGYGEFLATPVSTGYYDKWNNISPHCYVSASTFTVCTFTSSSEIWASVMFNKDIYSGSSRVIYIGSRTSCGIYTDGSVFSLMNLDNEISTTKSKLHIEQNTNYNVVLHAKSSATDGLLELFVNGKLILTFSGNVNNGQKFASWSCGGSTNHHFSNFIIADHDISTEKIYSCQLKNLTGTWDGVSDGYAEATDVDQTLSQNVDIDKLSDTILSNSSTPIVTSLVCAAMNVKYSSDKVNALKISATKNGESIGEATQKVTGSTDMMPIVFNLNDDINSITSLSVTATTKKQ